jgi:transcription initiation factor TFIIB
MKPQKDFSLKEQMLHINENNLLNKTKKNKNKNKLLNKIDKTKLWNIFDSEITKPLECLYEEREGLREVCDCCNHLLAYSDEGFLTCTNTKCGVIYKDVLDNRAEWRYYGADDNQNSDPTRCGMPINPLLQESSFGCKVLCLGSKYSYEMKKIRRYTEWQTMPYKEKTQYDEFLVITTMAQNSGIPKLIIDDAIRYHKKISEYDMSFRGDNRDGIIAASIYISCKINNYPRTAKEIATIFHLDVTSATKGCKNALMIINNIEKNLDNESKTHFCNTTSESFIERYCSKLNINKELTKLCLFIAIKVEKKCFMQENTPHSIAAGVIYFVSQVCNLNINKTDVKKISEVSEVTINKCCKKLEKKREELIPQIIIDKYSY